MTIPTTNRQAVWQMIDIASLLHLGITSIKQFPVFADGITNEELAIIPALSRTLEVAHQLLLDTVEFVDELND